MSTNTIKNPYELEKDYSSDDYSVIGQGIEVHGFEYDKAISLARKLFMAYKAGYNAHSG